MGKFSLKRQLPRIRQETDIWCIPASIEIAVKYLDPEFDISQEELWQMLDSQPPSFGIYKEILESDSRFKRFSFDHWGPGAIDDLRKKIQHGIRVDSPVLLSTPVSPPATGWHIRVCHTISDQELVMYNPGNGKDETQSLQDIERVVRRNGGGDILIVETRK